MYSILQAGCLGGRAFAALSVTCAALIADHTPNKETNGFFQLFRTMLTNKQKLWWNYQSSEQNHSFRRTKKKKRDPELQESLNNNNLIHSILVTWTCSMTVFNVSLNLDVYLLEPIVINVPIHGHFWWPVPWRSPPYPDTSCALSDTMTQHHYKVRVTFLIPFLTMMISITYFLFILW
jgi:hypothetical protein